MACKPIGHDLLLATHLFKQAIELRPVGFVANTDNPDASRQWLSPRYHSRVAVHTGGNVHHYIAMRPAQANGLAIETYSSLRPARAAGFCFDRRRLHILVSWCAGLVSIDLHAL